ncbi:MAG: guanylate kinase [Paludibacteraceae bacterium]|nr:guanylate kinase [Paludibacteraceae bacterium]
MILIFSAPSGAGKSTLVNYLLSQRSDLEFSVSCTTRAPRGHEQHGCEYYFISNEEFLQRVRNDEFVEYENVYAGTYYGTLKSEIERIESKGHHVVFDVDVKGGINLKKYFGDNALSIFVAPPSVDELRKRLIGRATDSAEKIEERVAKAEVELLDQPKFDVTIVNDDLDKAKLQLIQTVSAFLD